MRLRRIHLAIGLAALLPLSVAAHDRVVHYDVLYALAIAKGLPPDQAALVASASQGLDDNDSTTAYEFRVAMQELAEVASGQVAPGEVAHMKEGPVFHALTKYRAKVEAAHIARIELALRDPNVSDKRRLLYLGQYLHFVADSVVHPDDPLFGHAPEGTTPDRADLDYYQLRNTATLMSLRIDEYLQARNSDSKTFTVETPPGLFQSSKPIVPDAKGNEMLEQVMRQVGASWRTSGDVTDYLDLAFDWRGDARHEQTSNNVAYVMGSRGFTYTSYNKDLTPPSNYPSGGAPSGEPPVPSPVKIALTTDGEPLPGSVWGDFGPMPQGMGAFAADLAADPGLKQERNQAVLHAALVGAVGPAGASRVNSWVRVDDASEPEREAAAWLPPSSPGGIALDPHLDLPLDGLGTPIQIRQEGSDLVLRTERGDFVVDGVSPRSFATLARAISVGQSPYLSIGSEPSSQPGYARVSLSPLLRDTAEGRVLYEADLQFKTIFARLPLRVGARERGLQDLIAGYPGNGGDFVRFWITSSDIRLAQKDGHLVTMDAGMRINSETRIGLSARDDPEMEAYAAGLTKNWDRLAVALPQFRQVQSLALTTALVFWAREHQVPLDPAVLMIPPAFAPTPNYTPIVAMYDGRIAVSGGVSLAPEDRGTELGRGFLKLAGIRLGIGQATGNYGLARGLLAGDGALALLGALLIPALALWLLLRRSLAAGFGLRRALRTWTCAVALSLLVGAILAHWTVGGGLALFDRDLLRLASSFVLFPALLFALIKRESGAAELTPARRRFVFALSLCGPVSVGFAGMSLAYLTVAATGAAPTRALNRLLTAELAPMESAYGSFATHQVPSDGPAFTVLVPESLLRSAGSGFSSYRSGDAGGEVLELEGHDANLPAQSLRRVQWPDEFQPTDPAVTHYTANGEPPF